MSGARGFGRLANHSLEGATVIPALPYADSVEVGRARALSDPVARWGGETITAWYSFTPASGVRVEARAQGDGGAYIVLVVYAGHPDRPLASACATQSPDGPAALDFHASPGTTYFLVVGCSPLAPGGSPSRIDLTVTEAAHA